MGKRTKGPEKKETARRPKDLTALEFPFCKARCPSFTSDIPPEAASAAKSWSSDGSIVDWVADSPAPKTTKQRISRIASFQRKDFAGIPFCISIASLPFGIMSKLLIRCSEFVYRV